MAQKKKMASLLLGVGVLTTAALAAQKTDETQAATRKVTYTEGATTVWTSPSAGQQAKRYLSPNQTVEFVSAKQVGGTKWLETTDGGWVPETYLSGEISGSTSTTNNSNNSNTSSNTSSADTSAAAGTLTVTYASGATTVWQNMNFSQVKGYMVKGQTAKYVATKTINGGTWYQLADGGWVLSSYVSLGGAASNADANNTGATNSGNTSNSTNNGNTNNSSSTNTNNNSNAGSGSITTTAQASRQQIVNYAKTFMGVPYVWGGTTPAGFDCSGLVQYVYGHFGINLHRVTYQQEYDGTIKAASAAQAGDLVFFGTRGSTYHVAISLGNGQYIHAPQPGQTVTIGSSQWFAPSFAMSVPGVY